MDSTGKPWILLLSLFLYVDLFHYATQIELICGLYYKHVTIINYTSSVVNKHKTSLNDDTRVVIHDHHMFIVHATGEHNT